jgi:S1-C subfamily serine protease
MGPRDEALAATLVGTDPFLDLALLKVEGDRFPPLPLGDSDKARVGEWVLAIGNPLYFRNSVTAGVLSGKGRRLDGANQDPSSLEDYLQTDAPINFGNSGGPLLNARGEVIGINSAIVRDNPNDAFARGYIEGLGFALPISPVKRVLAQLAGTGTVKRGRLGISVQQVDPEKAEYLGLSGAKGAYVLSVEKETPAEKAGLQRDDVILAVDGKPVANQEELVNEISSRRPGDKVTLSVWRDRKEIKVDVSLIERTNGETEARAETPEKPDESEGATALGFTVDTIPQAQRERLLELDPPVKGVMITDVDPTSSAATKGLVEGLVLLDLNGQATSTVESFRRAAGAVKAGEVVRLRLYDPRFQDEVTLFFRAPGRK